MTIKKDEKKIKENKIFQNGATLLRLDQIFHSAFLQNKENISSVFYKSVFIECIIELNFLLQSKFQKIAKEINFNDDINLFSPNKGKGYEDVITLIQYIRNTVCHGEDIEKRTNIKQQHVAYSFQTGSKPKYPKGGLPHLCKYDDDIACIFGSHIIYIKRHLERVYIALKQKAFELPEQRAYKQLSELRQAQSPIFQPEHLARTQG